MSNIIPDIESIESADGERIIWFSNHAAIRVWRVGGRLVISYCRPRDDGEPFIDEFAVGRSIEDVTENVVERWEQCDTPQDYANEFPEVDVLTDEELSLR